MTLKTSFTSEILTDNQPVTFEFLSMNVKAKQLYQVYAPFNGKRIRFHMQKDDKGSFRITDRDRCPKEYLPLEKELETAILQS